MLKNNFYESLVDCVICEDTADTCKSCPHSVPHLPQRYPWMGETTDCTKTGCTEQTPRTGKSHFCTPVIKLKEIIGDL